MAQEIKKMAFKFEFHSIPETRTAPFTDNFIFSEGLARSEPGGFFLTPELGRHVDEFIANSFISRKEKTISGSSPSPNVANCRCRKL